MSCILTRGEGGFREYLGVFYRTEVVSLLTTVVLASQAETVLWEHLRRREHRLKCGGIWEFAVTENPAVPSHPAGL